MTRLRRLATLASPVFVAACGGSLLPGGGATDLGGPWRAEPFAVAQQLITEAQSACRLVGLAPPAAAELVVVDARGGGKLTLVFAGRNAVNACDLVDERGHLVATGGSGMEGGLLPAVAPNELVSHGIGGGDGPGGSFASVTGQAGAAIAAVRITTPSGLDVGASMGPDGWYAAWWPTQEMAVEIRGLDANGTVVDTTQ